MTPNQIFNLEKMVIKWTRTSKPDEENLPNGPK